MSFFLCLLYLCLIGIKHCVVGVAVEKVADEDLNENIKQINHLLVFFYQSPCDSEECLSMKKLVTNIADPVSSLGVTTIRVSDSAAVSDLGFGSEPLLVFYRDSIPVLVDVSSKDIDEIVNWIEQNKQTHVLELHDVNFEHETQASSGATTGDWFIQFYSPNCTELTPVWQTVASRLHSRLNVASVNVATSPGLQKRLEINSCPTIYFFRHGKMYWYELPVKDVQSFVSFAEGWYVNAPSKQVPKEATPFDTLVQAIVDFIRENIDDVSASQAVSSAYVAFFLFLVLVVAILVCRRLQKNRYKTD